MPTYKNILIKIFYSKSAFTLLELMLVVTIIAISTGAVVPSFNSFINSQGVKQAAEQVKSDLRSIQSNSLSNQVLGDMPISDRVYWGLYLQKDSEDYYYFVTNQDVSVENCSVLINQDQKFNLPSNTIPIQDYCVVFDSIDGSAMGSPFIVLKSRKNNNYECININPYGLISNGVYNIESGLCE